MLGGAVCVVEFDADVRLPKLGLLVDAVDSVGDTGRGERIGGRSFKENEGERGAEVEPGELGAEGEEEVEARRGGGGPLDAAAALDSFRRNSTQS